MTIKRLEDMGCEDLIDYCPLEKSGYSTPNGYVMCEGSHCKEAYEAYLEEQIDHEYTREIVCPYCGYEERDSWEVSPDEKYLGLVECENCGKEFYAERMIQVTYSTERAKYGTCEHCKKENVVLEDYRGSLGKYENLCAYCGENEKARLLKVYFDKMERESK